jgi:recombination protein RecR
MVRDDGEVFARIGRAKSDQASLLPEACRVTQISGNAFEEIIIALGTDVEGDATSFYLARRLSNKGVKTTRIAHGLPAGSGLEFADELTLTRALEGRREIT